MLELNTRLVVVIGSLCMACSQASQLSMASLSDAGVASEQEAHATDQICRRSSDCPIVNEWPYHSPNYLGEDAFPRNMDCTLGIPQCGAGPLRWFGPGDPAECFCSDDEVCMPVRNERAFACGFSNTFEYVCAPPCDPSAIPDDRPYRCQDDNYVITQCAQAEFDCPANMECDPSLPQDGTGGWLGHGCVSSRCTSDADCDGYCVNGQCSPVLGTCSAEWLPQS